MEWTDYLDFLAPDDIRIKGHRIGIDDVLYLYLEGYSPEEINAQYPSLAQEHIYATITYYLRNRAQMDTYLSELTARREQRYQEWASRPVPLINRLRRIAAEQVTLRVAA